MNLRKILPGLLFASVFASNGLAMAVPITGAPSKMVDGQDAFARITKLTSEIPWYTTFDYTKRAAQQQNKPIFFMHMLGPLNGKT